MEAAPKPLLINSPVRFAGGANADVTDFPATSADGSVDFASGFGSKYGNPPAAESSNWKLVKREDMNAIGQMASEAPWLGQVGGYHTFDETVCEAINGYPKGAVLAWFVDGLVYQVESLIDDNTWDFTAKGLRDTASNTDYWAVCSPSVRYFPNFSSPARLGYYEGSVSSSEGELNLSTLINEVEMPYDGYLNVIVSATGSISTWIYNFTYKENRLGAVQGIGRDAINNGARFFVAIGPLPGESIEIDEPTRKGYFWTERNCVLFEISGVGLGGTGGGMTPVYVSKGQKISVLGWSSYLANDQTLTAAVTADAYPLSLL